MTGVQDPTKLFALLGRARGSVEWASHLFFEEAEEQPSSEGDDEQSDDTLAGAGSVASAQIVPPHHPSVAPQTITAEQIAGLKEVTKENLDEDQMRTLLAKVGGQVQLAVNIYFERMTQAREDLKRRGLDTEVEQPVRKRRSIDKKIIQDVMDGKDDECILVGVKSRDNDPGLLELPHARCHCPTLDHVQIDPTSSQYPLGTIEQQTKNREYCANCFCWVCDVPAKSCDAWPKHCMAVDKHTHWQHERDRMKKC